MILYEPLQHPLPTIEKLIPHFDSDYTPKAASVVNATDFETSLGIDHACIVLPSVYGTNNSILVDALRQFHGSYRGVAVIDPDSIANATLAVFQEAGVRGCK